MRDHLFRKRIWLIAAIIVLSAFVVPSQFQKGGIDSDILFLIPIVNLILAYIYFLPMQELAVVERTILPPCVWFVNYFIMTTITGKILDTFDYDYDIKIMFSQQLTIAVNLLYFILLTFPLIGMLKLYYTFRDDRQQVNR
jgi:hypothetical protein